MRTKRLWLRLTSVLIFAAGIGILFLGSTPNQVGYSPEQPIAYSHRLHAGELNINCLFCHDGARRSPVANVPSLQRCMGCHKIIAKQSPELEKLKTAWQEEKPISWIRIHKLPEFTRFTHKRHVAAGVACQTCHGPIETMERVRQFSSLEMGWCVDCHKQRQASTDCLTCHH